MMMIIVVCTQHTVKITEFFLASSTYHVNAGFKRFYRVLRVLKKNSRFDPCISRVRFLDVKFWC